MAGNKASQVSVLQNVQSLLGKHFYIPKYQRGYRWTSKQVEALLNDIDRFRPCNDEGMNSWYCLQPLVVKQSEENDVWRLIDGQQRLTSIKLILHYLNQQFVESKRKTLFFIEYETRGKDEDWLKVVDDKKNSEKNIDFTHIYSAFQSIKKWFENKGENYDTFKFSSKLLSDCKFIWYDIDQNGQNNDTEEDVFIRLNDGKIPLTNSELIKAIFLNSSNFIKDKNEEEIRLRQLEISTQWDIIEQELSDNQFWYFINGRKNDIHPRIEYVFDVIAKKPHDCDDKEFTFTYFQSMFDDNDLKNDNKAVFVKLEWENILNTYLIFKEWFKDKKYYHLIGYLLCVNFKLASDLLSEYKDNDKDDFRSSLDKKINEIIKWDGKENIKYGDKQGRVSRILLLHNIVNMLNQENETARFPFSYYIELGKYDIEHIHPQNPKIPDNEEIRKDWLNEIKIYIEKKDLLHKINVFEKFDDISEFQQIFDAVETYLSDGIDDVSVDDLSNLCLLDARTNRSYHNDFFPEKRIKILQEDQNGTFIPTCTKLIFQKYYTKKPLNMTFWNKADREAYLNDIKTKLKIYLS